MAQNIFDQFDVDQEETNIFDQFEEPVAQEVEPVAAAPVEAVEPVTAKVEVDPFAGMEPVVPEVEYEPEKLGVSLAKVVANTPERFMRRGGGLMAIAGDKDEQMKSVFGPVFESAAKGEAPGISDYFKTALNMATSLPGLILGQQVKEGSLGAEGQKWLSEKGREIAADAQKEIIENQPVPGDPVSQFAVDVARGAIDMGPMLAAGFLTRSPSAAFNAPSSGIFAAQVAGDTYIDRLEKGVSQSDAMSAVKFNLLAEALPEQIPVMALLKKGTPFIKRFINSSLGEGVQETVTAVLQDTYDKQTLEGMSLKDALLSLDPKSVLYQGAVGMGVGGALSVPASIADYAAGERAEPVPAAEKVVEDAYIDPMDANANADAIKAEVMGAEVAPVVPGIEIPAGIQPAAVAAVDEGLTDEEYENLDPLLQAGVDQIRAIKGQVGAPALIQPEQQVAQLEAEARAQGITEPTQINQYVMNALSGERVDLVDYAKEYAPAPEVTRQAEIERIQAAAELPSDLRAAYEADIEREAPVEPVTESVIKPMKPADYDRKTIESELKRLSKESKEVEKARGGTIFEYLASKGGLNIESMVSSGMDKADARDSAKKGVPFGKPLFRQTGGMTVDEATEAMAEIGIPGIMTEQGPDLNAAFDMIHQSVKSGEPIYLPGDEAVAAEQADRRLRNTLETERYNNLLGEIDTYEQIKADKGVEAADQWFYEQRATEAYEIEEDVSYRGEKVTADTVLSDEAELLSDLVTKALAVNPELVQSESERLIDATDAEIAVAMRKIIGEPAPAVVEPEFVQPHELRMREHEKAVEEEGLTEKQAARFAPKDIRDVVTGMYRAEDRMPTLDRAKEYIAEHGNEGSYADIDLRNLGGLNEAFTHVGADKHFKAFSEIVIKHLPEKNVVTTRHGGDEMSVIAPRVTKKDLIAAMTRAQNEIDQYVKDNDLTEIEHPKHTGKSKAVQDMAKGTGIYFGVANIDPALPNNDIINAAEEITEASKPKELQGEIKEEVVTDGDRRKAEETGIRRAEARRGAIGVEPARPEDRREGVAVAEKLDEGDITPEPVEAATAEHIADEVAKAAASPENDLAAPSIAQIDANNYAKGHPVVHGINISIENPAGSKRQPEWPAMAAHYGDLLGTEGSDGDPIDVFIKPDTDIPADNPIFVIDQITPATGKFDESKIMMGYATEQEARDAYRDSYTEGWTGLRDITEVSPDEFKTWLKDGNTKVAYKLGDKPGPAEVEEVTGMDTEGLPPRGEPAELAEEVAVTPEKITKKDETEASKILTDANVTGKDRLETMSKFRDGTYSLNDLKAAYPAEEIVEPEAVPVEEVAPVEVVEEKPVKPEKEVPADEWYGGKSPDQMTENEFIALHKTGFIDEEAYKDTTYFGSSYETSKKHVKDFKTDDGNVEFRKSGEKLKYVKTGKDGFPVRDENDDVVYLSDAEIEEKGYAKEDKAITAYLDKEPIGFVSDEFGAIGVWVNPEYQGLGVGSELLADFMFQNPNMQIGQMTDAGEKMSRAAYRKLKELVVSDKVPAEKIEDVGEKPLLAIDPASAESKADKKPAKSITAADLNRIVGRFQQEYKGAQPVKFNVRGMQDETFGEGSIEKDGRIKGGFYPGTNEAVLIAENIENKLDAIKVIRHEIVGHYGFRQLLNKDGEYDALLDRVYAAKDKELKALYSFVKNTYPELIERGDTKTIADEMIARAAETKSKAKLIQRIFDEIIRLLNKFGITKGLVSRTELNSLIRLSEKNLQKPITEPVAGDGVEPLLAREDELVAPQTDTPAFKSWFGDSKVVDEAGEPLVVYHGTSEEFEAFDPERAIGGQHWFTTDKAAIEAGEVGAAGRGRVVEAYLSIQNPAGWKEYDQLTLDELIARGYDGIALPEKDGTVTYVAFEPAQIKSPEAIRFDPTDPRILFAKQSTPPKQIYKVDETTVAKGAAKTIQKWAKRNFTKEGLLNKTAFELRLKMDAAKNFGESELSELVFDFEKSVAKAYGVKKYNDMSEADLEDINRYLRGDKGVALPKGLHGQVDHLRAYLDRLSGGMIVAMDEMLEIERSRLSEKDAAAFAQFEAGTGGYLPESMQKHWNISETIKGNMGVYMTRSYQAFDDAKWKDIALADEDLINRAIEFIAENNPELNEDELVGAVRSILQSAKNNGNFMSFISKGSKLGAKDVSIINKKKNVPAVIRELLGEYKDPKVNFIRSASKMQWFQANHNFLMKLRENGLGVFLFEKPVGEFDDQIVGDASETMNPISGLYSTEDFSRGLDDAVNKFEGTDLMRNIIMLNSFIKYGKAQPLSSIVYTPSGARKMGDLAVGDYVCGVNGRTEVLGIYPQPEQEIFNVTFADGSETEASGEHLWEVIGQNPKYSGVFTTNEIKSWPEKIRNGSSIPLAAADFDSQDVIVEPYLLGALIGDGCVLYNTPRFSTSDDEMLGFINEALPKEYEIRHPEKNAKCDYSICRAQRNNEPNRITEQLKSIDMWGKHSYEKFIPDEYKYNSVNVRMAIVQGLLDTDGYVIRDGQPGFATSSKQLAYDLREIAESLGATVLFRKKDVKGYRPSYELKFRVSNAPDWFRLTRHKENSTIKKKPVRRMFRSIESVGNKPCQCILVDDEDHLYLTDRFIVTHNTILAPTTQARNFMSASMFAVLNGHFDWREAGKAFKVAKSDLFTKDKEWRKYTNHLVEIGVMHDNPFASELRDAIRDFTELDVYSNKPGQNFKKFLNFMQKSYQLGDDFWKIIGFENEMTLLRKAGLSEAEAEEKAAYRIRNGYPTYSMVPRGIKMVRRWPLIGTFVSFPYEIMRTSYNQIQFLKEDLKDNKPAAARRAIGMAAASSAAYAASIFSMMLMGMDADDDEAVRAQLPPWSRNSQLIYTGYDENGMPQYMDLSYIDPYTYLKKPLTALFSGNNEEIDDKFEDAMMEFLDPFIGVDIGAGALGEIIFNQKIGTGRQVYNPEDEGQDKAMDIMNHIRKAVQPGIVSNMERTVKALSGESTPSGKQYDIGDEAMAWIGFRFGTLNLPQSMAYKGYEFKDRKTDATRILNRVAGSSQKLGESEIENAVNRARRARELVYKDMMKQIQGSVKLGMDERQVRKLLRGSKVSNTDISFMLKGDTPRWILPKTFMKSAMDRARLTAVSDERREELKGEFIERRALIRRLIKESN